jgi:3-oxoacyl-[acyl-carrier protein] reductase
MKMLLKGKVAIVTGASRGIGAATAVKLAEHGAAVAVNYNQSKEKAAEVVAAIQKNHGRAMAVKANVFDREESDKMVREVEREFGKIDIVVLNAGGNFKNAPFMEQAWEDFEKKILHEVKASFWTLKAVLPSMIERKSGSVIIISSGLSRRPNTGFSAHSTAKSALDAFAKSLAFEMGPMQIRVNVVAPGLVLTDATSSMPEEREKMVAGMTPLRRIGLPEDIAGAVLFYASDESKFITGNYLPVNGGQMML